MPGLKGSISWQRRPSSYLTVPFRTWKDSSQAWEGPFRLYWAHPRTERVQHRLNGAHPRHERGTILKQSGRKSTSFLFLGGALSARGPFQALHHPRRQSSGWPGVCGPRWREQISAVRAQKSCQSNWQGEKEIGRTQTCKTQVCTSRGRYVSRK